VVNVSLRSLPRLLLLLAVVPLATVAAPLQFPPSPVAPSTTAAVPAPDVPRCRLLHHQGDVRGEIVDLQLPSLLLLEVVPAVTAEAPPPTRRATHTRRAVVALLETAEALQPLPLLPDSTNRTAQTAAPAETVEAVPLATAVAVDPCHLPTPHRRLLDALPATVEEAERTATVARVPDAMR